MSELIVFVLLVALVVLGDAGVWLLVRRRSQDVILANLTVVMVNLVVITMDLLILVTR